MFIVNNIVNNAEAMRALIPFVSEPALEKVLHVMLEDILEHDPHHTAYLVEQDVICATSVGVIFDLPRLREIMAENQRKHHEDIEKMIESALFTEKTIH